MKQHLCEHPADDELERQHVVARSPDRATGLTEGLPKVAATATNVANFGHDHRFGQCEKLSPRRPREHREKPVIPKPFNSFVLFVSFVERKSL